MVEKERLGLTAELWCMLPRRGCTYAILEACLKLIYPRFALSLCDSFWIDNDLTLTIFAKHPSLYLVLPIDLIPGTMRSATERGGSYRIKYLIMHPTTVQAVHFLVSSRLQVFHN